VNAADLTEAPGAAPDRSSEAVGAESALLPQVDADVVEQVVAETFGDERRVGSASTTSTSTPRT